MTKDNINSTAIFLRSDEVSYYKYLSELLYTLDNVITSEVNKKIQPHDTEIQKFKEKIEKDKKKKHSEIIQALIIHSLENVKNSYANWKNILWASLFLSVYSNYESKFNQICEIIMEENNLELSYKDLKGSGLQRVKKYLTKVTKYQFSIEENRWQRAENYNKIRNIVAHNENKLEREGKHYKDRNIYNFVKSNSNLILDSSDKIIITKEFVLETTLLFHNMYLIICDELGDV